VLDIFRPQRPLPTESRRLAIMIRQNPQKTKANAPPFSQAC